MVSGLLSRLRSPRVQRPVFIVGCGRSGTTLLFQLLRHCPAVTATSGYPDGEDHAGWNEHGQCRIAGLGYSDVEGGHTGYTYCLHQDEGDATPDAIAGMHRYYWREVLGADASKRVLNKCPHLSNKLGYVRAIFPDACFVHIVRDCVPVVASWMRVMAQQPNQVLYWPATRYPCFWVLEAPPGADRAHAFRNEQFVFPGGGVDALVQYWIEINRNIPILAEGFAAQLFTVRYEDLCTQPLQTLNSILAFCDLPSFATAPLDDYQRAPDPSRGADCADVLGAQDVARIEQAAQDVRRQFGYLEQRDR